MKIDPERTNFIEDNGDGLALLTVGVEVVNRVTGHPKYVAKLDEDGVDIGLIQDVDAKDILDEKGQPKGSVWIAGETEDVPGITEYNAATALLKSPEQIRVELQSQSQQILHLSRLQPDAVSVDEDSQDETNAFWKLKVPTLVVQDGKLVQQSIQVTLTTPLRKPEEQIHAELEKLIQDQYNAQNKPKIEPKQFPRTITL